MNKKRIKAILLDRDGTVIYERPGTYLSDPEGVKLYSSTLKAFEVFTRMGYKIFIVSNQSGIGRGYFTDKEVRAVNNRMKMMLSPYKIKDIIYCPHSPEEKCNCRKPLPYMGLELIKKYNIDPSLSYMIGDKKSDTDFGHAIGMTSILVKTANGAAQIKKYGIKLGADFTAANLLSAAKIIEKRESENE
ncbi:D-glycero-D-manno-heptose 1 [Parelusimicrobium proximum]|uniref:D-glycero-alpha-D-manno-heptose-1,7-bisphosphate 7-phosphatase n=1 Tax=Parelusimicrobium proximum TaxID=3228953 RepID=UPI003D1795C8